jgi:uncharacterized protein
METSLLTSLFGSLLSPMVLAFALGIIATLAKSDLKFPEELYLALTIYLLIAIGLKGGYKLSLVPLSEFIKPLLLTLALGVVIPVWSFFILLKLGKLSVANSAAIAAHYGSASAATFSAAIAFLDTAHVSYEGYMPGLLAVLEVPAILVAIVLSKLVKDESVSDSEDAASLSDVLRELLTGKSAVLLVGCLAIGLLAGKNGWEQVAPFFDSPFRGILMLFLLEAGLVTGRRLGELKRVGFFLIGFGILIPLFHALIGIVLGKAVGLSEGGAMVLGVLSASASYIAAPAACRVALPQASPSLYLTSALAITFPFNIVIGLPLYWAITQRLFQHAP